MRGKCGVRLRVIDHGIDCGDERRRRHDMVGRNDADRNNVLRGDNDGIGRHCHDGIEVARGKRVGKIAKVICQKCVDQRKIRAKRGLEQEVLAVDLDLSLAFLNDGPDARRRQHTAQAEAAGPNAFDERALGHQADRHFIGQHLFLYVRI